jgi:hypothetical protein
MTVIAISYDEWFPYYDIRKLEKDDTYSEYEEIVRIEDEDYIVYQGLLTQMERLQIKLEKLYKQGSKVK